jgi:hypothetical protein
VWDGFPALAGLAPSKESQLDLKTIDFARFPQNGYVRYGDPDLSQAQVEATGDGRHVGAISQAILRVKLIFWFLEKVWPGGDRAIADTDFGRSRIDAIHTASTGRQTPYTVVVPPGYFAPENAAKTYPVVYVGHGYGQAAMDLAQAVLLMHSFMVDDQVPEARRMQKFIAVLIDAKCQPGGDVGTAPLSPTGDLCETGAFYTDHAEGTYRGEEELLAIQAEVESRYRVRPPADITVRD